MIRGRGEEGVLGSDSLHPPLGSSRTQRRSVARSVCDTCSSAQSAEHGGGRGGGRGAKLRRCLAGAQRLCGDSPPPASFCLTKQTRSVSARLIPTRSARSQRRVGDPGCAENPSPRCSGGGPGEGGGGQGPNVQNSVFLLGQMRTTIRPPTALTHSTSGGEFGNKRLNRKSLFPRQKPEDGHMS